MSLAGIHSNPDLEGTLLAALKAEPGLFWAVADLLEPSMFTGERQAQARAWWAEHPAGGEPDPDRREEVTRQARDVAELYLRRELVTRLEGILVDIPKRPVAETLGLIEGAVSHLANAIREDRAGQLAQATGLFPALLEDLRARRQAVKENGAAAVGLATGFKRLDDLLGGLQPGLHILAAEPGAGKTTCALQIAGRVARDGTPALFVSFEETLPRLALKALCQLAGLHAKQHTDGRAEVLAVEAAVAEHGPDLERLYFLEGTSKTTAAAIRAKALQVLNRHQAKRCLVVVDYVQRWAGMRKESSEYRLLVDLVAGELRELALRLDSPVLAICSQNRAGGGEARMDSLKESGNLEYGADSISILTKQEGAADTPAARGLKLALVKNRYGDRGEMALVFRPASGQFAEEAPDQGRQKGFDFNQAPKARR